MTISTRFTQVRTRLFLSSAIVLTLLCSSAAAEVLVFSVKGVITQKRTPGEGVSVFAGDIGDKFDGTFSYDTEAPNQSPSPSPDFGFYPLVDFSIDGTPLNVSTGTEIPFLAGVLVDNNSNSDRFEVRGFHTPAIATPGQDGFNDYGVTSILLSDSSGSVFDDNSLPDSIDLDNFDDTRVIGPIFGFSPIRPTRDEGVISVIGMIPEPSTVALLCVLMFVCPWRKIWHR